MYSRQPLARWAVLILGLGLTVSACGKYSFNNLKAIKSFKDGNAQYQKNNYPEAAALYQDVISRNPTIAMGQGQSVLGISHFYLANSYDNMYKATKKGDPTNDAYLTKAAEEYRQAVNNLPGDENKAFRKRSLEFLLATYGQEKLNDFDKAEPVARELIATDPTEPSSYQTLGKLYEEQGRYPDAEAAFLKAVELKPDSPDVYQILAGYYNRQAQFDKTMTALEKRAAAEPNNPEAYHYMATFYQEKVQKDLKLTSAEKMNYILKGIAADDRALQLNPDYAEAMVYKGILLHHEANITKEPAKQAALIREADDLKNRAMELVKRQNAGAGATKKGGGI